MYTPSLVTIGIASYNNAHYIEQMLDSVRNQTHPLVELVVVDDCSTDNSVEVITNWLARTSYPATFIRHERNKGIVRTFNECRAHAHGEYVSWVGSDDVLHPTMVAETVAEFERQGVNCGAVYADCQVIDSKGEVISPSFLRFFDPAFADIPPQGNLIVPLLEGFYLPALTTTIRHNALDKVGEYDLSLYSEDLDMWLRLSRHFRFAYLPSSLGSYRVHDTSAIHTNRVALNETYFRIYNKAYFEGPAEWAAARHNLADQAEHYYASIGPAAREKLWYVFRESKSKKVGVFWALARLGFRYDILRPLLAMKSRG